MESCAHQFFITLKLDGMTLDQALRSMSSRLCLPAEAQQIDRLVQAFSKVYCSKNPGVFPDEDAAYLTSFAIVMLNADAHSKTVKQKMTKAEFVKNCKLATPSVSESLLEGI